MPWPDGWVKLARDGVLVEFPSAIDALAAAIEFQQAMTKANRTGNLFGSPQITR